jgi:hypothetical protein
MQGAGRRSESGILKAQWRHGDFEEMMFISWLSQISMSI